uniref:RNase H domain-containing protein n=1 Tax=Macrostomum lignano TaxID=282301 RepID=A0A1I8JNG5_9PLAT
NFIYAAEQWADRCGLRLSETKTAAIMFTSRTKWQIRPLTLYGREIPFCKQTKCLGITLDHRLNWSPPLLAQLRRAVGTTWGLTPKRLWWIYTAMVRPAISYGGLIWASALQIKTCLEALRRAQGRACRTIMSAPPSAPYDGLNAFLNIPPLDIFVRREAAKTARRLADAGIRIQPHRAMAKRKLLPHADLCLKDLRDSGGLHVLSDGEPRTLNLFQRYKVTIPSRDAANDHWNFQEVHCYTDGSIKDGRAGFGVCIIINGRVIATHAQHTGRLSTVFQNEVLAISSCAAELNAKVTRGKTIVIHSDSQAALQALCHTTTNSRTVADCARQLNLLARSNTVRLKWIPGHAGFPGNELADTLAKRGGSGSFFGPAPLVPMPLTVINRQIDDWADSLHRDRWAGTQNCRQSRAAVPCPSHRLRNILLNQNRKDIRALVMTLTGHGYLARHCFLRGDLESEICPFCECDNEDAQHFVCHCPFFNRDRLRYLGPNPSIDETAPEAVEDISQAVNPQESVPCGGVMELGLLCVGEKCVGPPDFVQHFLGDVDAAFKLVLATFQVAGECQALVLPPLAEHALIQKFRLQIRDGRTCACDPYLLGFIAVTVITVLPTLISIMFVCRQAHLFNYWSLFLVEMAVGSLTTEAIVHLLPALILPTNYFPYLATVTAGVCVLHALDTASAVFFGRRQSTSHAMEWRERTAEADATDKHNHSSNWRVNRNNQRQSIQQQQQQDEDKANEEQEVDEDDWTGDDERNKFYCREDSLSRESSIRANGSVIADPVEPQKKCCGSSSVDSQQHLQHRRGSAEITIREALRNPRKCFEPGPYRLCSIVSAGSVLHSFAGGIAIGAAFVKQWDYGLHLSVSVGMHELAHKVADFSVLTTSGFNIKAVLLLNFCYYLSSMLGLAISVPLSLKSDEVRAWITTIATAVFVLHCAGYHGELRLKSSSMVRKNYHAKNILAFFIGNLGMTVGYLLMMLASLLEFYV